MLRKKSNNQLVRKLWGQGRPSPLGALLFVAVFVLGGATYVVASQAASSPVPATFNPQFPDLDAASYQTLISGPVDGDNATKTLTSKFWGGYVDSGTTFRQAQGTFRIPTVNCKDTANHAYPMALWVGLDGSGKDDKTLEQTGVVLSCFAPSLSIRAWWETYPGRPQYIEPGKLSIEPGDEISATVTYEGHNEYAFELYNNHNGKWFGIEKPCHAGSTCNRSTAEWIAESQAPGDVTATNPVVFSTTNTLYFTSGTAIGTGSEHSIGYFRHTPFDLVRKRNGKNKIWLHTDSLNRASGDTAFTIEENR